MNQQENYRHKRTSVISNYHLVWCLLRRKKVLTGEIANRLEGLLYEKAFELDCEIIALEIMPDHVHLFISTPPKLAPDQVRFRLKGYTSRILRKEYPQLLKLPSLWTRSYYCGTAGNMSSETVKKCIANQKTH